MKYYGTITGLTTPAAAALPAEEEEGAEPTWLPLLAGIAVGVVGGYLLIRVLRRGK